MDVRLSVCGPLQHLARVCATLSGHPLRMLSIRSADLPQPPPYHSISFSILLCYPSPLSFSLFFPFQPCWPWRFSSLVSTNVPTSLTPRCKQHDNSPSRNSIDSDETRLPSPCTHIDSDETVALSPTQSNTTSAPNFLIHPHIRLITLQLIFPHPPPQRPPHHPTPVTGSMCHT